MADNGLDGRKVLVMPNSPDGLFGPHRRAAVENMALLLSAAIADALDRIPVFNRDGQPVLLIDGALRAVNAELLGWLLEAHFTTPHVVERAGRLELEHRGVRANEIVLRHMLVTEEAKYGGLLGRLPMLTVEQPQTTVEEKPREATSCLPEVQAELDAGARQIARHANSGAERTRIEIERGREVSERHRRGRQATAEKPVETPIESYPAYVPAKSNAAEKPTDTQA
jgi:hypothetical protein